MVSQYRQWIYVLSGVGLCLLFTLAMGVVLSSFGIVAYSTTEDPNFGGSPIEFVSGLDTAIQASISDTTVLVTGCTNQSVATSNTAVTGKVLIAHGCPAIEDRLCVASTCTSDGLCKETTAGECSLDEQCVSLMGQNYGCETASCVCVLRIPPNGSATSDGLACVGEIIEVANSSCPVVGQVLTAVDNQTADWQDPLNPFGVDIVLNGTISVGDVLVVEVENTTAVWKSLSDAGIATLDATETLTNKTFTDPIIETISNGGTITLPNTTSTLLVEQTATGTATFTGIYASNPTAPFRLSKIGHDVTLLLGAMNTIPITTATSFITTDEFIPADFFPSSIDVHYGYVLNNNVTTWAFIRVISDGTMQIHGSITAANFASGTPCGIDQAQVFTWYT